MAIIEELNKSKRYLFEPSSHNNQLVDISIDNVARVEAIISIDSNYNKSFDRNLGPIYDIYKRGERKGQTYLKYGGSTAYWMTKLKETLESDNSNELEKVIFGAVSAVDRENTTHLTADKRQTTFLENGAGRREITNRILGLSNELLTTLKDREKGFELIKELSRKTADNKGRANYSFATKFCHYACFYCFEGEDAQDNYSIYDDVLGKALIHYARAYLNEDYEKECFQNYELYSNIIDRIRDKAATEKHETMVSRNGFDHLLWYFHKGNPISLN